jgi:TonB family protein
MRHLARIALLICLGLYLPCSSSAQSSGTKKDQASPDASNSTSPSPGDSTKIEPIKSPKTNYPLEAKAEHIHGTVWVQVLISETGDVKSVEVLSGEPALTHAAVEAAKQWKFKPYIKNGKPIEISAKLPMKFGSDSDDANQYHH